MRSSLQTVGQVITLVSTVRRHIPKMSEVTLERQRKDMACVWRGKLDEVSLSVSGSNLKVDVCACPGLGVDIRSYFVFGNHDAAFND